MERDSVAYSGAANAVGAVLLILAMGVGVREFPDHRDSIIVASVFVFHCAQLARAASLAEGARMRSAAWFNTLTDRFAADSRFEAAQDGQKYLPETFWEQASIQAKEDIRLAGMDNDLLRPLPFAFFFGLVGPFVFYAACIAIALVGAALIP